eukprot:GHVS01079001.1.p1 GENE.GHVS01079001.1~~GHVS01079001.1.p1  ORF type:complete len:260 (+),score=48.10 GHVS01079001.1:3-782(+)
MRMPYPGFFGPPPMFPPYPMTPPPLYTRPQPMLPPQTILRPQQPAFILPQQQYIIPQVMPVARPVARPVVSPIAVFPPQRPAVTQPPVLPQPGIEEGIATGLNLIGELLKSGLGGAFGGGRTNNEPFEDILDLEFRPSKEEDNDFKENDRKQLPVVAKPTTITSDTLVSIDALDKLSRVWGRRDSSSSEDKSHDDESDDFKNGGSAGESSHRGAYLQGYEDGYVDGYGDGVDTGETVTKSLWCSIDESHPLCSVKANNR